METKPKFRLGQKVITVVDDEGYDEVPETRIGDVGTIISTYRAAAGNWAHQVKFSDIKYVPMSEDELVAYNKNSVEMVEILYADSKKR